MDKTTLRIERTEVQLREQHTAVPNLARRGSKTKTWKQLKQNNVER